MMVRDKQGYLYIQAAGVCEVGPGFIASHAMRVQ